MKKIQSFAVASGFFLLAVFILWGRLIGPAGPVGTGAGSMKLPQLEGLKVVPSSETASFENSEKGRGQIKGTSSRDNALQKMGPSTEEMKRLQKEGAIIY